MRAEGFMRDETRGMWQSRGMLTRLAGRDEALGIDEGKGLMRKRIAGFTRGAPRASIPRLCPSSPTSHVPHRLSHVPRSATGPPTTHVPRPTTSRAAMTSHVPGPSRIPLAMAAWIAIACHPAQNPAAPAPSLVPATILVRGEKLLAAKSRIAARDPLLQPA